jgi:asparagine synthase (glutamine-hydrolysing)
LAIDMLPRRLLRVYRSRTASPYVAPELAAATAGRERPALGPPARRSPIARELFAQAFDRPLPELLRYADRSSMAHSREVRLPFLDPRVAEFAFSLPASSLYMDGISKRIARDAVRGLVPGTVLDRRDKVAFEPPQARWLNDAGFRTRIAEVLLDPTARGRGLYDPSAIEADLANGSWRNHGAVWRALNAELWHRTVVEKKGRRD